MSWDRGGDPSAHSRDALQRPSASASASAGLAVPFCLKRAALSAGGCVDAMTARNTASISQPGCGRLVISQVRMPSVEEYKDGGTQPSPPATTRDTSLKKLKIFDYFEPLEFEPLIGNGSNSQILTSAGPRVRPTPSRGCSDPRSLFACFFQPRSAALPSSRLLPYLSALYLPFHPH